MASQTIGSMTSYQQNVANVVSQAAIHLHNQIGSIGTALFDRQGTLLVNNNALRYASESTLTSLVLDCLKDPALIHQRKIGSVSIYAAVLDKQHVFIIAGKQCESGTIDHFLANLRKVLP